MRTSLVLVALAMLARADVLEDKYKAKLNKPFVKAVKWITDYDTARKQAKESGRAIFVYFSRSFRP